jgi:pimeloyl-ACP methyl ester carboxylesterase
MSAFHPLRTSAGPDDNKREMLAAASALLLLIIAPVTAPSPSWWQDYSDRARHVAIGEGRTLNLLCEGRGSPTIILESGTGDGMTVWRKVQPVLAEHHEVCAYDRAGLGFSPPDFEHRDLNGIVRDFEKLTVNAHLRPPYLLVSHSFGGMVFRIYARKHPRHVLGMVLVDPPSEGEMSRIKKIIPDADKMAAQAIDHDRSCAGAKDLSGPCAPFAPDDAPPAIAARLRSAARDHYRTEAAEMQSDVNGANDAEIERVGTDLGNIPLIVLTSEQFKLSEQMPPELRSASQDLWMTLHNEIAAHSTRGSNRVVPGTGHYIQLDRPDAVVAAVEELAFHRGP